MNRIFWDTNLFNYFLEATISCPWMNGLHSCRSVSSIETDVKKKGCASDRRARLCLAIQLLLCKCASRLCERAKKRRSPS